MLNEEISLPSGYLKVQGWFREIQCGDGWLITEIVTFLVILNRVSSVWSSKALFAKKLLSAVYNALA